MATLVLVIAPSGSGKGALMGALKKAMPQLVYPVSCTTRAPRAGEHEGDNYHFITEEAFDEKIHSGEFLEWAQYGGNRYGTLRHEILPPLDEGRDVVREVEAQGARQILSALLNQRIRIIYIDAGSWEELEQRIVDRASISSEELALRRERYEDERTFMGQAFKVVKNPHGKVEQAVEDFIAAVREAIA